MNGMRRIRQGFVGVLVMGMALWNAAIPAALAQIEPHVLDQCRDELNDPTIDPELAACCRDEVLPKLEEASTEGDAASPEAKAELRVVENTAAAIAETTKAVQESLKNPEAVTQATVEALARNGVPAEVAGGVEAQMKDALAKASAELARGGSLDGVSKYFAECQKAISECSGYLGGKDLREVLTSGGPVGLDRPTDFKSLDLVSVCLDPKNQDVMEAAMKAHFETAFKESTLRSGTEGARSPEMMRGMMEQMAAVGINPAEMMARAGGEFHGPSPEAMAAMSREQRTAMESQFKAMETQYREMGAHIEAQMREMGGERQMREMIEKYGMDPRTESSGSSAVTFSNNFSGDAPVIAHVHSDGTAEMHRDINKNGVVDPGEPAV